MSIKLFIISSYVPGTARIDSFEGIDVYNGLCRVVADRKGEGGGMQTAVVAPYAVANWVVETINNPSGE